MRIAAFRPRTAPAGTRLVGLVLGEGSHLRIHPFPDKTDLLELLRLEPASRTDLADTAASADGLSLESALLMPPIYPVAMRDFLTFEEHVEGVSRGMQGASEVPPEWYAAPSFLFMAPHAVHGPFDYVEMPPDTERLDFELELAAVICRDVRNESPERAASAIGGYLVMNDWSARDVQRREMTLGLGPSKGKDFATTIGPWIVTADSLEEHHDASGLLDLHMSVRVNGELVGEDRSGHMGWSFAEMVSYASRASWVKAGEVIASGTCATGALAETWGRSGNLEPRPLRIGDTVDMTVQGIGTISNQIVPAQESAPPIPRARVRVREQHQ